MQTLKKISTIRNLISKLLLVSLLVTAVNTSMAYFAGGEGTEDEPWRIETAEQLNNVREFTDSSFLLTADIDLDEFLWDDYKDDYINEGEGWEPIGCSENAFRGVFDGSGYRVKGLYINRGHADEQGLFGETEEALIKNLLVENVNIYGGESVGAIVGQNDHSSTVYGCYASGYIEGYYDIGGLVGLNFRSSSIINSSCSVIVEAENQVGGLCGRNNFHSLIENSFSTGTVKGERYVGGITGWNWGESLISNSYSSSNVKGTLNVGGLVGKLIYHSKVINCYSVGEVLYAESSGGLVGAKSDSHVENSYWNTETSGIEISFGGSARTTEQMTYPYCNDTYKNWNFDEVWEKDDTSEANEGYPYLQKIDFVTAEEEIFKPSDVTTLTNYPNPFNPKTNIKFELNNDSNAELIITNTQGQLVKTLYSGKLTAGEHRFNWDGTNNHGKRVGSGVYLYRLSTQQKNEVNKMLMLK